MRKQLFAACFGGRRFPARHLGLGNQRVHHLNPIGRGALGQPAGQSRHGLSVANKFHPGERNRTRQARIERLAERGIADADVHRHQRCRGVRVQPGGVTEEKLQVVVRTRRLKQRAAHQTLQRRVAPVGQLFKRLPRFVWRKQPELEKQRPALESRWSGQQLEHHFFHRGFQPVLNPLDRRQPQFVGEEAVGQFQLTQVCEGFFGTDLTGGDQDGVENDPGVGLRLEQLSKGRPRRRLAAAADAQNQVLKDAGRQVSGIVLERRRQFTIAREVAHVRQRQHRFPPERMQRLLNQGQQEFAGHRTVASAEGKDRLGREREILRLRGLMQQTLHAALLVALAQRSNDFEAGRSPHRTVERRNQHST